MNTRLIIIGVLLVLIVGLSVNLFIQERSTRALILDSFDACVSAGYPVMESYPRQCRDGSGKLHVEAMANETEVEEVVMVEPTLTMAGAQSIATSSTVCTDEGPIGTFETYNPNSGTWWFTLEVERKDCGPACVVDDRTKTAEVNWRCTGLRQ